MTSLLARAVLGALTLLVTLPAHAQDGRALSTRAHDTVEHDTVERPTNLILMIADGFGPASATLARESVGAPLSLDTLLVGSIGTPSTDSRVTDSAASATAYACGIKTYNGAIAVDTLQRPCRTLIEKAKARGMVTGLVATSRITHATPAAFAAHVPSRSEEAEIALQLARSGVDLIAGGGLPFFLPSSSGGIQEDSLHLLDELAAQGYEVVLDRSSFDALGSLPAIALLAPSHLAYEIDRDPAAEPSLAEMTTKALALLSERAAGPARGFFLMIEGSRIDHAGHANDPAAHLQDILAYDQAVAAALDFARSDGQTLLVSVADHETGGLSLGRDGIYAWDPEFLSNVRSSVDVMAARIRGGADPQQVVTESMAIDSLTAIEVAALRDATMGQADVNATGVLSDLVSKRAGVGWTTRGHTGVDVGLYRFGPGGESLVGSMPNDALGRALSDIMQFEQ